METPSWQDRVNESKDPEQAKRDFIARQKMGRLGTADEIAALVVYLASQEVTNINKSLLNLINLSCL